jgi:3-deoxy-D-manno-octulosonate 8-phosphate phosphatase KdsC-like HAD superfamily phosphatase
MNRVIFLDIDGVLNSKIWDDEHQREIRDGKHIDINAVRLLSALPPIK